MRISSAVITEPIPRPPASCAPAASHPPAGGRAAAGAALAGAVLADAALASAGGSAGEAVLSDIRVPPGKSDDPGTNEPPLAPGRCRRPAAVRSAYPPGVLLARRTLRDLHQELDVGPGLLEPVQQEVQGGLGLQRVQHLPQLDHDRGLIGREQQILLARARRVDVDSREHPLVGDLAVQLELGVAGALELLEDD